MITKALRAQLHIDSHEDYGTSFVLIVPIKTTESVVPTNPATASTQLNGSKATYRDYFKNSEQPSRFINTDLY